MARHFHHWLKAYCAFTASSEAPLDFHFWTGVSTLAGALRRRVWKDELLFKWTPNFYIIFVGPPGIVTKSTSLSLGYDLLKEVPGVHFGPDSMTWQGLGKRFTTATEYVRYPTAANPNNVILMSPLTCSVSELGTFLKPDDRSMISFLTDVWDGKERPFDHGIKMEGGDLKLENAWLNVIGATTPDWMRDNFPVSMLSQGIGSRIVFVYGETKRHLTAYPSRKPLAQTHFSFQKKLIEDLTHIATLVGPYELTDEAYKWGEAWYDKHHSSRDVHLASGRYAGYLGRKQTHMHKLAMVLAAAQRDDLLIEKSDLEEAETILVSAEHSMIKVFESVGVVDEAKHVAEIVAFVRAYKWLSSKDLYRLCYNIMSEKDFHQALRISISGDLLEVEKRGDVNGVKPKQRTTH